MSRSVALSLAWFLALLPLLSGTAPVVAQAVDITVEIGSGDFERGGTADYWHPAPADHGGMFWTRNTEPQDNFAKWRPTFPQDGDYEVFVFIPNHNATTRSARYEVHHRNGVDFPVVDQLTYNNEWATLGVYPFEAGKSTPGTREPGYLFLGDVTGEQLLSTQVGFGATRFVLQGGGVPVNVPEPLNPLDCQPGEQMKADTFESYQWDNGPTDVTFAYEVSYQVVDCPRNLYEITEVGIRMLNAPRSDPRVLYPLGAPEISYYWQSVSFGNYGCYPSDPLGLRCADQVDPDAPSYSTDCQEMTFGSTYREDFAPGEWLINLIPGQLDTFQTKVSNSETGLRTECTTGFGETPSGQVELTR